MASEKLRQFASAAAAAAVSIARPNYFDTSKRGETYELRNELNSDLAIVRKEAVKKVIASMTIGKDVSSLFPDVLKNIQTDDMEMKKLVYLYLMNYAKSQPELVILAINTFCKDATDANPLIRALAIRTMGCLRVDKVLDYLMEPLLRALQDENAYVRKTAAICAAKVVELAPELAEENGFVRLLQEMVSDSNATVITNAVAALSDIHSKHPELGALQMDTRTAARLVSVLNDCSEWGQITILDALAFYQPESNQEALQFIEKITPRLQHVNTSVVLSSIKVILVYMGILATDHEMIEVLKKKLAPPLVSMLSNSPAEIQYVALRNINLILQKRRDILAQAVRVFFCKFNDPIYVKLEKLEIIKLLIDEDNSEQVLSELAEYIKEVDAEFAKKSFIVLAECALAVPKCAEKAFMILRQTFESRLGSTPPAVIVSLCILLRKYHHLMTIEENAPFPITLLSECELELFDDEQSRASFVWLLGEYGDGWEGAAPLLMHIGELFFLEPTLVQSELLIACLKLFFKNQDGFRAAFAEILSKGSKCIDNADIRDRCIMYSRLLTIDDPSLLAALDWRTLALQAPRPQGLPDETLAKLLPILGTCASVYHRVPESFTDLGGAFEKPPPLPDLLDLDDDEHDDFKVKPKNTATSTSTATAAATTTTTTTVFSPNKLIHTFSSTNSGTISPSNVKPIIDLLSD